MSELFSTKGGTVSGCPGVSTVIQIVWPAAAYVTCGNQLLELSGALSLAEQDNEDGQTVFLLSAAVAGNTGRVVSLNGFGPVTVTTASPGQNGLVTFPPRTLLTWTGGLGGPFVGIALKAVGWLGFAA